MSSFSYWKVYRKGKNNFTNNQKKINLKNTQNGDIVQTIYNQVVFYQMQFLKDDFLYMLYYRVTTVYDYVSFIYHQKAHYTVMYCLLNGYKLRASQLKLYANKTKYSFKTKEQKINKIKIIIEIDVYFRKPLKKCFNFFKL